MKKEIDEQMPRPWDRDALQVAVLQEGETIEVTDLLVLIKTMPQRTQYVIRADGGPTR